MASNKLVSVIIPTLNEEEGIGDVIKKAKKNSDCEIIVVDGLSTDNTVKIAKKHRVKVVYEKRKGKGIAMRTGVKNAKGSILVFMDGDDTHDPKYIPKFLEKLEKIDMVVGNEVNYSIKNRKLRIFFNILCWTSYYLLAGYFMPDPIHGFRAIRKRDFEKLNLKENGFEIETEMNIKAINKKFKISRVNLPLRKRKGKVKMSFGICVDIVKFLFRNNRWKKYLDLSFIQSKITSILN